MRKFQWILGSALLACTPGEMESTSATSSGASDVTTTTGVDSDSSTSVDPSTGATTEATTTTGATSTSTTGPESTSTTEGSTGAIGCGDGIAELGEVCFEPIELTELKYASSIVAADMNEDGHLDLVGVSVIPCPLVDDGALSLAGAPRSPAGAPRDAASSFTVWIALGDGTGGFTPIFEVLPPFDEPSEAVVADFDGDGHLDVGLGAREYIDAWAPEALVFPGDGAGGLADAHITPVDLSNLQIKAADVDGDQHVDLIAAGGGALTPLLGDGAGGFQVGPTIGEGHFGRPWIGDLDQDGDLDLLTLRRGESPALVSFFGGGDGTFVAGDDVALTGTLYGPAVVDPAVGERPAVVVSTYESKVWFKTFAFEIGAGGGLEPPTLIPEVGGRFLATGSFDGGPRPDLLLVGGGATVDVLVGAEPWPSGPTPAAEVRDTVGRPAIGDFDEDGVDDVVLLRYPLVLLRSNP
ncbi:MAG: VCBS repeat-containing protein [Nannocystaceae bacterium]